MCNYDGHAGPPAAVGLVAVEPLVGEPLLLVVAGDATVAEPLAVEPLPLALLVVGPLAVLDNLPHFESVPHNLFVVELNFAARIDFRFRLAAESHNLLLQPLELYWYFVNFGFVFLQN